MLKAFHFALLSAAGVVFRSALLSPVEVASAQARRALKKIEKNIELGQSNLINAIDNRQ
jgi:hypothetical protein